MLMCCLPTPACRPDLHSSLLILQDGLLSFKGVPRHLNPVVCAINALAFYMVTRFTLEKEPFPDPRPDDNGSQKHW
jgi:hypothetical protein